MNFSSHRLYSKRCNKNAAQGLRGRTSKRENNMFARKTMRHSLALALGFAFFACHAVITLAATPTWIQEQEVTPSLPSSVDDYGGFVYLHGSMAFVSASDATVNDQNQEGLVYVYN